MGTNTVLTYCGQWQELREPSVASTLPHTGTNTETIERFIPLPLVLLGHLDVPALASCVFQSLLRITRQHWTSILKMQEDQPWLLTTRNNSENLSFKLLALIVLIISVCSHVIIIGWNCNPFSLLTYCCTLILHILKLLTIKKTYLFNAPHKVFWLYFLILISWPQNNQNLWKANWDEILTKHQIYLSHSFWSGQKL